MCFTPDRVLNPVRGGEWRNKINLILFFLLTIIISDENLSEISEQDMHLCSQKETNKK